MYNDASITILCCVATIAHASASQILRLKNPANSNASSALLRMHSKS